MPYPDSPYGILITSLADALTTHCAAVGETVNWLHYSDVSEGTSGQSGEIIFNIPETTSPANNELEIIVRSRIWRGGPVTLLTDAGNAFNYIDLYLRGIAAEGLRVTQGGRPYDLFRGWKINSLLFPEDEINIDRGRALTMAWICKWNTEGLIRDDWGMFG